MSSLSSYNTLNGPFASQEFVILAVAPIIIGSLVNLVLYGVATSHFYDYVGSRRYSVDTFRLRSLVFAVMGLATIQTGLQSWIIYHYSICQSRTADVLFSPTFVEKIATLPVGFEGMLVQAYLAQRGGNLFKLKRNKIIYTVITGLFIEVGFVGSMLYFIGSFVVQANIATQDLPPILSVATTLWLYGCAFADISIAVVLIVLLRNRLAGGKGFQKSTDSIIRKLSILALSSSSATALFASVPAFLILAFSTDALHAGLLYAFVVELSSLYAISLLVNLNSRDRIRAKGRVETDYPTEIDLVPATVAAAPGLLNTNSSTYETNHLSQMRKGFEVGLTA